MKKGRSLFCSMTAWALLRRVSAISSSTERGAGISRTLQLRGDRVLAGLDQRGRSAGKDMRAFLAPGIFAGQQCITRRRARRRRRMGIGEAYAFGGEAVDVRRGDLARAVAVVF